MRRRGAFLDLLDFSPVCLRSELRGGRSNVMKGHMLRHSKNANFSWMFNLIHMNDDQLFFHDAHALVDFLPDTETFALKI